MFQTETTKNAIFLTRRGQALFAHGQYSMRSTALRHDNGSSHASKYPQGGLALTTPNTRVSSALNQRRSQRIIVAVPIRVTGKQIAGAKFVEETNTLMVNAHGALIALKEKVEEGQVLTIHNLATADEIQCAVIDVTVGSNGAPEIGVEFQKASPNYWRVSFPPSDWSPRSPEAKGHVRTANNPIPVNPTLAKK